MEKWKVVVHGSFWKKKKKLDVTLQGSLNTFFLDMNRYLLDFISRGFMGFN